MELLKMKNKKHKKKCSSCSCESQNHDAPKDLAPESKPEPQPPAHSLKSNPIQISRDGLPIIGVRERLPFNK